MTGTNGPYCTIVQKRAKDLNDRDVIRWNGTWREVLAVWHSEMDIADDMGDDWRELAPGIAMQADKAFGRILSGQFVIVRLLDQDKSVDEVEAITVSMYHLDLMHVQSLPAWDAGGAPPDVLRMTPATKAIVLDALDSMAGLAMSYGAYSYEDYGDAASIVRAAHPEDES